MTLSCVGSTMDFVKDFDILGSLSTKNNLVNISKDINKQISQANKLKQSGDAPELGRTPSSQNPQEGSVNPGGNDSLNQHLETIRTSIDKVLESRDDMTEEEKAAYKEMCFLNGKLWLKSTTAVQLLQRIQVCKSLKSI